VVDSAAVDSGVVVVDSAAVVRREDGEGE